MLTDTFIKRLQSAMRKGGKRITFVIDGLNFRKLAVVQNSGRNFMRKYDDDHLERRRLGYRRRRDKIAFLSYFVEWESADNEITVVIGNKLYVVVADSVIYGGDKPLYIWALLSEINRKEVNYYDNIA